MLSSHDDTNSPYHDTSGQHQDIHQMNEIPTTKPSMSPNKAVIALNIPIIDGKDEANKLLTESSHEGQDDREPYTSAREETRTKFASPVNNIFLNWWPETAWYVFSTALIVALAALLKAYDQKPAPEWVMSLNTVVAAVSTTCRASIVIPVSEGFSQLKWNAFARSQRPLNDLQTFDQASRRPFGSLVLLSKARGRLLDRLKLELKDPDNLGDFVQTQLVDPDEENEYWRVKLPMKLEDFKVDDVSSYTWVVATTGSPTLDDWAKGMDYPTASLSTQLFIYKKLPYPTKQRVRSYKGAMSPYRAVAVTWYWCIKEYERNVSSGTTHIKTTETDFRVIDGPYKMSESIWQFTLVDNITLERFPVTVGHWLLSLTWKVEPFDRATDGLTSRATDRIIVSRPEFFTQCHLGGPVLVLVLFDRFRWIQSDFPIELNGVKKGQANAGVEQLEAESRALSIINVQAVAVPIHINDAVCVASLSPPQPPKSVQALRDAVLKQVKATNPLLELDTASAVI
ncbi:uncharacterized protein BKA55DRAFT_723127 [Fusarium redolens]|uniref:Uncharacterized protein n=1 Tax=Fusarium redolens TaxID=48865 RepID=A0A9P9FW16_FUSRE|nr:uncharacterized protein BKA55DRAFT_723127 [Fusarium redolens]KAH7203105.1 hypothetical protein BKA55DRAFT_723127 [Fusarium redolens]